MNHLIRTDDFTTAEIEAILADAKRFSDGRFERILQDKIIIGLGKFFHIRGKANSP